MRTVQCHLLDGVGSPRPDSAQRKHLQRGTHVGLQGNLGCLFYTDELLPSKEDCDLALIICSSGYRLNSPQGLDRKVCGISRELLPAAGFCRGQQAEAWEELCCVLCSGSAFPGCEKVF